MEKKHFERCDVTTMTSYGHVTYRLPIVTDPLAPLVSEVFDLKVADKHTSKHRIPRQVTMGSLKAERSRTNVFSSCLSCS